jgi:hypothetical protein
MTLTEAGSWVVCVQLEQNPSVDQDDAIRLAGTSAAAWLRNNAPVCHQCGVYNPRTDNKTAH